MDDATVCSPSRDKEKKLFVWLFGGALWLLLEKKSRERWRGVAPEIWGDNDMEEKDCIVLSQCCRMGIDVGGRLLVGILRGALLAACAHFLKRATLAGLRLESPDEREALHC